MRNYLLLIFFSLMLASQGYAQKLDHVLGDVIVKLTPDANPQDLARKLSTLNGQRTSCRVKKEVSPPMRIWLLQFDFANINENDFLAEVWRQSEVEVAQFNRLINWRETTPDDPDFDLQWHWVNPNDADVDADLAWDITTGGTTSAGDEIVVCVVEGADRSHPDLLDNLWFNEEEIPNDGVDNDGNGYIDDYNGWNPTNDTDNIPPQNHGTQVSSVIGAVGNNGMDITGINWDVKIMHVEVGGLNEANVMASYTYPMIMRERYNETNGESGAFVVATNSSWGLDQADPVDFPLWCAFYDSLGVRGILSCGATSNFAFNIDVDGDMPTACPSDYLVSVTATDNNDVRTFSGFGVETIDVGAPGEDIYMLNANGGTGTSSGTSFASPLTAGIIALLYSAPCSSIGGSALVAPAETAILVRDYLYGGVDEIPNLLDEVATGGRVNAFNSLQLIAANCGPCPAPFALEASNVIDTSATISWLSTDSTLSTNLRWRAVGADDWNDVDSVQSPITLDSLLACTEYEFQLQDFCADTTSDYTASVIFQTDGCCFAPTGLTVSEVTDSSAFVTWDTLLAANSYNIIFSDGAVEIFLEDVQGNTLSLSGLEICTEYFVQVQSQCDTGLTDFSMPVFFETFGCGACTDLDYCESNASSQFEFIQSVSINGIENISGDNEGYGDFTGDFDIELTTYNQYDVVLTPEWNGDSFGEYFKVWIDFDQSGTFNNDDELVLDSGPGIQEPLETTIIVPGTALPGYTRMRVSMEWEGGNDNQQPEACETGFEGEVEDYCVTILEGEPPVCSVPDSLEVFNIMFDEATLTWALEDNALSYNVQFRPVGSDLWTTLNGETNELTVSNLEVCTEYEFQVEAVCIGTTSGYSESFTFTTECFPPCDEIPGGLDTLMVNENSAEVTWNATQNADSYEIRFREMGAPAWFSFATAGTSTELIELTDCTEYEFQVRANCPVDQQSNYSASQTFMTDCISNVSELNSGIRTLRAFPNPFNEQVSLGFSLDQSQQIQLEVLNAQGQILSSEILNLASGSHQQEINISGASGLYFIRMMTETGSAVRRVIKK